MKTAAIVGMAVALITGEASSAEFTRYGNNLLEQCEAAERVLYFKQSGNPDDVAPGSICIGYITGAADFSPAGIFCPPDEVTIGQEIRIVLSYARANPQLLHAFSSNIVWAALRNAFPCPNQNSGYVNQLQR
jgi:hypothetical protein